MAPPENMTEKFSRWGLTLGFGLREANGALTISPFATLFHEFDSLEALHYRAFTSCAAFTFERVVLGHKIRNGLRARKLGRTRGFGKDEVRVNFTSRRDMIGFLGLMITAWICYRIVCVFPSSEGVLYCVVLYPPGYDGFSGCAGDDRLRQRGLFPGVGHRPHLGPGPDDHVLLLHRVGLRLYCPRCREWTRMT